MKAISSVFSIFTGVSGLISANKAKKRARRRAAALERERAALAQKRAMEQKKAAEERQRIAAGANAAGRRGLLTLLDDNTQGGAL